MSQETWAQLPRPTASRPFSWIDWPCLAINAVPRTRISFANAFTSACLVLIQGKTEECQEIWTYSTGLWWPPGDKRCTFRSFSQIHASSEKPIQTNWTCLISTLNGGLKKCNLHFRGVEPGKWNITIFSANLLKLEHIVYSRERLSEGFF